MTRMGLDLPAKDVDALFDTWDPSGSGSMDLKELQKALRPKPSSAGAAAGAAAGAGAGLKKAVAAQKAAKAFGGLGAKKK